MSQGKIQVLTYTVGPYMENTYLVSDGESGQAAVIDPGGETPRILSVARKKGWTVTHIFQTHGHVDHIAGTAEFKAKTGALLMIHRKDLAAMQDPEINLSQGTGAPVTAPRPDDLFQDGQTVNVGKLVFQVIHTPGHTPGGVCLLVDGLLFSGDTLFARSIGRSDFPGGNARVLLESIRNKLFILPGDTVVYPGHGEMTTIAEEKTLNPFL